LYGFTFTVGDGASRRKGVRFLEEVGEFVEERDDGQGCRLKGWRG